MRLSPVAYDLLQHLVHGDYEGRRTALEQWYAPHKGGLALEIGCGTGEMARFFSEGVYTGIDTDLDRIRTARGRFPGATFLHGDVSCMDSEFLSQFRLVFAFNVLHHLSDDECQRLLGSLRSAAVFRGLSLHVAEPTLPRFVENPVGFLLAKADDGKFVRTLQETTALFLPSSPKITVSGKPPWFWPVPGATFEVEFTVDGSSHNDH